MESECITSLQSLRDRILIMNLLHELNKEKGIITVVKEEVKFKAFEEKSGGLKLSRMPNIRPRINNINTVYHNFRSFIIEKEINIHTIDMKDKLSDTLTKHLDQNLFQKHQKVVMGW